MSSTSADRRRSGYAETTLQKAALVVGLVFLVVGVAGFVPGLTSDLGTLSFASHHSDAMLLGIFQVSVLHNLVHLLFGIVGVLAARSPGGSRPYLIGGGVVYFALWLFGLFVAGEASAANFVPLNDADNWLHLALAVGMVGLGVVLGSGRAATPKPRTRS